MASRAPRTQPTLTALPTESKETMRTLTAAELDYYRTVLTETQHAEQQFAQAQEALVEARGAVKSLHRQFVRKYQINPNTDGIDMETGLIGPLTPAGEAMVPTSETPAEIEKEGEPGA
jgi:hypothetical protein